MLGPPYHRNTGFIDDAQRLAIPLANMIVSFLELAENVIRGEVPY